MTVIVYGDFNCPYSYLASQRADLLSRAGVAVDWRAVEHDRGLPVTGSRSDSDRATWDRELAEVASLAAARRACAGQAPGPGQQHEGGGGRLRRGGERRRGR